MQRLNRSGWLLAFVLVLPLLAQDTPPAKAPATQTEEEVSTLAAQWEAELGKVSDTSPEAADLLLQLVDLYHAHGRVFGLIRSGQLLVNNHAAHPRHRDVMLKLLDGLQAASRNKETTAISRQFLARYPEDPACPHVEVVLARTLEQLEDFPGVAAAQEVVWRRQPQTPLGKRAGVRAVTVYEALNNAVAFKQAATVSEEMFAAYTGSELATQAGLRALYNWERAGEYARLNLFAHKMVERKVPADPIGQRDLHRRIGENYSRMGQYANAAASYRLARPLGDNADLHRLLIEALYNSQAKGADLEPVVTEYFQKYPEAKNRFALRSYVAHAYGREGNRERAAAILAELLPYEAVFLSNAVAYVQQQGTEPAELAKSEQTLKDAIGRNPEQAYYLRYVLGADVYRDRMKDLPKARQMLREMLTVSPSNDGHSANAISWLLYTAPNDAEFQADVAAIIKVRRERAHWGNFRVYLGSWILEALRNAEHKPRAEWAKAEFDKVAADPYIKEWIATETGTWAEQNVARAALAEPTRLAQMNDEQAWSLLYYLSYYYRHYGNPQQRVDAAMWSGRLAARFPKNVDAALLALQIATDYAPAEVQKEAALHLMTLEPSLNDADAWYRLLRAAEINKDPALARQALAWKAKSEAKFGPETYFSYVMGDVLERMELKAEATALWQRSIELNLNEQEVRQCGQRLLARIAPVAPATTPDPAQQLVLLRDLYAKGASYHGYFAVLTADIHLRAGDIDNFEKILVDSRKRQDDRGFAGWGLEEYPQLTWIDTVRNSKEMPEEVRRRVFRVMQDAEMGRPSAAAGLALLELPAPELKPMERLLALQLPSTQLYNDGNDWERMMPYAQAAMARNDYAACSTILTSILENLSNVDANRRQVAQQMLGQSYARMGGTGLAIDESSPIAPLMQAALYLRLGDQRLALETYNANRALFDQHRDELPADLILFVSESHIAGGGDENFDRAEDILRNWLVKNSEAVGLDDATKARVQLTLAKNYFRAQRYDVARSEYTTVINRYPNSTEAVEAEFGIGETFMAQKVYDQAEAVFEKLSGNRDREVVIRAEFLRGVLANRRGDLAEARDIFRSVLDRVPNVELANQTLYNLAEVYGSEQRYMDALELLRTVGRLGRNSKRTHAPGLPLSIVVQDSDLGTSQGRVKIPVRVVTEPGGDEEIIDLLASQGSKGLFRADLSTQLGQVVKGDRTLQISGNDVIRCDYPESFKADFRYVPLSDAEIRVASDAKFTVSSSRIVDEAQKSFSQILEEENQSEEERDRRTSQARPQDQLKPGNPVYIRVQDADRDLSDEADQVSIKLQSASGDAVTVKLQETGVHTGQFEGTAPTAELPAGALASDTAIDHSPLMAIDQSLETFWLSEPDGATPKSLTVDMKDLRVVSRVAISTPDPTRQAPVRGELQGSNDGRFWFRIGTLPAAPPLPSVAGDVGPMNARIYAGNYTGLTNWNQVVEMTKNAQPIATEVAERLMWNLPPENEEAKKPYAVLWHGKLVQPRAGAARIGIAGVRTALMIDGRLELDLGVGDRTIDVWLDRGTHDLTVFAATTDGSIGVNATWAKSDHNVAQAILAPFRKADFDLDQPAAKPPLPRDPAKVAVADNVWNFAFDPIELRHIRFIAHEYLGEALAINNIEVAGEEEGEMYIPTQADVLSLAANNVLELSGGDIVTATYTDDFTQNLAGRSQLLTGRLTATYFDASLLPIAFDFERQRDGQVLTIRKELMRIDPGERFVVEIVDYDLDQTNQPDSLSFKVAVNDAPPVELKAIETQPYSGIFTKEVDTSAMAEKEKLTVKPGDRVYVTYVDAQNTFPGHAVPRETVVYVNQPSEARMRILETRVIRPSSGGNPSQILYKQPVDDKTVSKVALEAPITVEVYDRDAAKDARSTLTIQLTTSDGAKIDVTCVVSPRFSEFEYVTGPRSWALEEGRFIGQVILQLGGKDSPSLVPLSAGMPRDLVGGTFSETGAPRFGEALVTQVLNLTGKDIVTATYKDKLRPRGPAVDRLAQGRLIANGELAITDRDYEDPVTQLHVGEKLYLRVQDADLDVSDNRDFAELELTTEFGDKETITLEESLVHSGIFTGSVLLKTSDKPVPGNLATADPAVETYFGDTVQIKYLDKAASTENGALELNAEVPVVIGTDGLVQAFSKTFNDENLAVETKFRIAESYFELFKSHRKLERKDQQLTDLEAGKRALHEVMQDFPNPKYIPRISYLLGQFAQELEQWHEAIDAYQLIVRQYPESTLAPDAQYKLAQCYEEAQQFPEALEAYVTLAATYPQSPLIANVMIRISDHFYKEKNYEVAAQVGEKFLERFESHEWASKMAFRIGQCYYKGEQFTRAGESFDKFSKIFPEDPLTADSLFWAGESFRKANNNSQAFRRYNRCRWDFPATDAAKYARGRLALPEMLAQFESEANSVEDNP